MRTEHISIAIFLIFFSCHNHSDPFKDVRFGTTSSKNFIEEMIGQGVISDPVIDNIYGKDTIYYTYNFKHDGGDIPLKIEVNSKKYNFGSLRKLKLTNKEKLNYNHLKKDSINTMCIQAMYKKWYGSPVTIKLNHRDTIEKYIGYGFGKELLMWKLPNFNLFLGEDSKEIDIQPKSVIVTYEMPNLKNELDRIRDSIEVNQTVKNLLGSPSVSIKWDNINKNLTSFEFRISNITRIDSYDSRGVKTIRFDLILEDEFGEEIYRANDFTYSLNTKLYPDEVSFSNSLNTQTYNIEYNHTGLKSNKLEQARKYAKNNKLVPKVLIKKVVMDDNSVIE